MDENNVWWVQGELDKIKQDRVAKILDRELIEFAENTKHQDPSVNIDEKMDRLLLSLEDKEREVLARKLSWNYDEYNIIKSLERDLGGTFISPYELQRSNGEIINIAELIIKMMTIIKSGTEPAKEEYLDESGTDNLVRKHKDTQGRQLTLVVAGFPGVGKTAFFENNKYIDGISDSDSSKFSWISDDQGQRVRNPDFPNNYIKHIQELIDDSFRVIFVSTHREVIEALIDNGIDFIIVHPARELKKEYLRRYIRRGSLKTFVDMMDDKWDYFINDIMSYKNVARIKLTEPHESISDIFRLNI